MRRELNSFQPAISVSQLLGAESQVLLYYTKKRHNHSFEELAIEFNTNARHISAIFWRIARFHNRHLHHLPQFNLYENSTALDSSNFLMEDHFFRAIIGEEFLLHKTLICSVTDRSYLKIEKSSNILNQKRSFCSFKSGNVLKLDMVTNAWGKILLVNPLSKLKYS